jgi:hypothetical protein
MPYYKMTVIICQLVLKYCKANIYYLDAFKAASSSSILGPAVNAATRLSKA